MVASSFISLLSASNKKTHTANNRITINSQRVASKQRHAYENTETNTSNQNHQLEADELHSKLNPNKLSSSYRQTTFYKPYRKNINKDAFLAKTKGTKIIKDSPVFLIGFPRSGTTLLDTILRSHPEIDVLEEKPLINSVEQIIKSKFKCSLDNLDKLTSKDLDYLRNHYLEILRNNCDNKSAKILIDKFPSYC